jgi:DNA-binding LacI/PurR family transcriptional regulator
MRNGHPRIPKHERIREKLRERILKGKLAAGTKLPPDRELFKSFGVNRLTMVQALNSLVREGLIVRRRGDGTYVASRSNPPLIPGRHLRLGLLWSHSVLPDRMMKTFPGWITRGVLETWGLDPTEGEWPHVSPNDQTRAVWQSVERGVTVECLGESLASRQRHPLLSAVRDGNFDGLICLSIIEEPWLNQVLDLGIPTVLADFPTSRLTARADLAYVDPQFGFRSAVEHFAKRGLKRIFFVGSHIGVGTPSPTMTPEEAHASRAGKYRIDPDSFLRLSAYRQAMDEFSLPVQDNWIHYQSHDAPAVKDLARSWIALPEDQRPQAVVCHSLAQTQWLMEEFAERGLWLEGAGGSERPSSTAAISILINGKWVGETAAELIISRLSRPTRPPLRVGVPMQLEERKSEMVGALQSAVVMGGRG